MWPIIVVTVLLGDNHHHHCREQEELRIATLQRTQVLAALFGIIHFNLAGCYNWAVFCPHSPLASLLRPTTFWKSNCLLNPGWSWRLPGLVTAAQWRFVIHNILSCADSDVLNVGTIPDLWIPSPQWQCVHHSLNYDFICSQRVRFQQLLIAKICK